VHAFPEAGLGVTVATDGCIYQSEVFAASGAPAIGSPGSSRDRKGKGDRGERERERDTEKEKWGGKGVLVLVGIRLGIDGVNPVYYDTIKVRLFPALSVEFGKLMIIWEHGKRTGTIHFPPISRNSRRTTIKLILLRWVAG
jgi:hypothetical protein